MSSFKKRIQTTQIIGTRPSPYNSLPLLSTGLTSLDDLLGGGLPLSASILVDSDEPTSYSELLLKFWIAQGLECKQDVVVVGSELDGNGGAEEIVKSLMGVEGGIGTQSDEDDEEEKEKKVQDSNEKLKIAFRYKGMKQHAVTVEAPSNTKTTDTYCSMFDLTTTMTLRPSDKARIHLISVDSLSAPSSSKLPLDLYELLFQKLSSIIQEGGYSLPQDSTKPRKALRIAISSLGSPAWGSSTSTQLYKFLHRLRHLLRHSSASLLLTFPSSFYPPALLPRLSHALDSLLTLKSFANSPASLIQFPKHNGLIDLPKLPNLNSLIPPGVKLSVLRGLGGTGDGKLDLGFRVKRRRFVVETVGGDEPYGGSIAPEKKVEEKKLVVVGGKEEEKEEVKRDTKVRFAGEAEVGEKVKVAEKVKKSVSSIMHSKPELYEF